MPTPPTRTMKATFFLLITTLVLLAPARADQVVMKAARAQAVAAHSTLKNNATSDKGGHRLAAMKHLAAAIAEIEAGIAFDATNVTANEGKRKRKN